MRVLVAISILAFLALLWASIAIFRHVRRARRRRRRSLEASFDPSPPERFVIAPPASVSAVPEITFRDPEAPLAEVAFTDPEAPLPEPAAPAPPAYQPAIRLPEVQTLPDQPSIPYAAPHPGPLADTGESINIQLQNSTQAKRDPALSPLPAWPHFGFTPARPIASKEPIPYAAPPPSESSTSIAAARATIEIQPPAPAVKPLYPSARPYEPEGAPPPRPLPLRAGQLPLRRVDWAFNDDMGDLSDPAPAGSRPRMRAVKSEKAQSN